MLPKIYYVNWFLKDDDGKFIWPGYGENSRVLKWVFERCNGTADAVETPLGMMPTPDGLDLDGLDISAETLAALLKVDPEEWKKEFPLIEEHYAKFGDRLPAELREEFEALKERMS